MMTLNDEFEDIEFAFKLLEFYDFDYEDTKKVMTECEILYNYVYPFISNNELCHLIITPVSKVKLDYFEGELDIVDYLNKKNFQANKLINCKDGRKYHIIHHDRGDMYVCAYTDVSGISAALVVSHNQKPYELGVSLASLHKELSKSDKLFKRPNINQIINDTKQLLLKNKELAVLEVFNKVTIKLLSVPINDNSYGLIHFNTLEDNVIGSLENNIPFRFIHFDQSIYGYYGIELVMIIERMKDIRTSFKEMFLTGYKTIRPIPNNFERDYQTYLTFIMIREYIQITNMIANRPSTLTNIENEYIESIDSQLNKTFKRIMKVTDL